jgi:hypothetical protein
MHNTLLLQFVIWAVLFALIILLGGPVLLLGPFAFAFYKALSTKKESFTTADEEKKSGTNDQRGAGAGGT